MEQLNVLKPVHEIVHRRIVIRILMTVVPLLTVRTVRIALLLLLLLLMLMFWLATVCPVSYTHLTLPTIYSV